MVIALGAMLGFVAFLLVGPRDASGGAAEAPPTTVPSDPGDGGTAAPGSTQSGGSPTTTPGTSPSGLVREPNTIPAWTVGQPWGTTSGFTMFRGNPTRTYYGTGPISDSPAE